MATVSLKRLRKRFGKIEAVRGIDLEIADGEFVVSSVPRAAARARRCG